MIKAVENSKVDWRRLSLVSAVLSSFVMAAPAFGSEAECLWNHLRQADRDAFIVQISSERANAVRILSSKVDAKTIDTCRIPNERLEAAARAFGAFAQERAATVILASQFNIAEPRLIAAWNTLPEADRHRYAAIVHLERPSVTERNFQVDVILKFIAKFPDSSLAAKDQLSFYFDNHAYMAMEK